MCNINFTALILPYTNIIYPPTLPSRNSNFFAAPRLMLLDMFQTLSID